MTATSLTILVTGASRGIGAALVGHLAGDGHRVVAACRDPAAAPTDGVAGTVALDVDDPESVAALPAAVVALLGDGSSIDVLVNNAGIKQVPGRSWAESAGPMPALDREAMLAVLTTNVVGPLLVTQALVPMLRRPGGVVLNVSSQLGSLSAGVDVDYAYNSAKAALNMATVTMGRDLGRFGIVPVALNPGWMKTDMTAADEPPLELGPATREIADLIPRLDGTFAGRFVDRFGEPVPW